MQHGRSLPYSDISDNPKGRDKMSVMLFHYKDGGTGWMPTDWVKDIHLDNPDLVDFHDANGQDDCNRCERFNRYTKEYLEIKAKYAKLGVCPERTDALRTLIRREMEEVLEEAEWVEEDDPDTEDELGLVDDWGSYDLPDESDNWDEDDE